MSSGDWGYDQTLELLIKIIMYNRTIIIVIIITF